MIQRKYIFITLAVFLFICVLYYLLILYPRQGKVAVEVLVHPSNSTIYIDGQKSKIGVVYLPEGEHEFKAQADGWTDDKISLNMSSDIRAVALLPKPSSDEAKKIAMEDSAVREGLAGVAANTRGLAIRDTTPILNELPYSDISGPFKIDYGFNQDDNKTPYLIVSYSSPNGRINAIKWLKKNNVNITQVEIIFDDFINPIQLQEVGHE